MERLLLLGIALLSFGACTPPSGTDPPPEAQPSAATLEPLSPPPSPPEPAVVTRGHVPREGGTLVRAPRGDALYLADEDHALLRRIPLPIDEHSPPRAYALPGRPAQVLALGDRVLVSVRDPGLLLVFRSSAGELAEEARVPLPADAWGLSVTGDGKRALISSAWTQRLSLVDLDAAALRWSVEVAREPRGVVVRADGSAAYVTHLVGTEITLVENLDSDAPSIRRLALPAAPLRSGWDEHERTQASLGYAAVLSSDERRLHVARHALGSLGWSAWFGSSTVDVLALPSNEPVAPRRTLPGMTSSDRWGFQRDRAGFLPDTDVTPFVQPRAIILRPSARTLLVAGEGNDVLAELDALSAAPALAPLRIHVLSGPTRRTELFDFPQHGAKLPASACGAPSGIALSEDEQTAYVHCRSTDGIAIVPLEDHRAGPAPRPYRRNETYVVAPVAESPLPELEARGRRLFYDATDPVMSGGLGCAGCHPEGRDDGFVWRELHPDPSRGTFFAGTAAVLAVSEDPSAGRTVGRPRQTPMLAGRVEATGPYGWLAESPTLVRRIREGFGLHRWMPFHTDGKTQTMRAEPLAAFLREGLVPPPVQERPLGEEERRGQEIFSSDTAACARCHAPESEYTSRLPMPLPRRRGLRGFDADPIPAFKVPSLFYVGRTAPYFHDGSASTLDELIDHNLDRMGMTSQLSAEERNDLVAYLRRIEPPARPRALPGDRGATPWRARAHERLATRSSRPRTAARPGEIQRGIGLLRRHALAERAFARAHEGRVDPRARDRAGPPGRRLRRQADPRVGARRVPRRQPREPPRRDAGGHFPRGRAGGRGRRRLPCAARGSSGVSAGQSVEMDDPARGVE
jgi:DNA-binding beta-propeller fold protein YncE